MIGLREPIPHSESHPSITVCMTAYNEEDAIINTINDCTTVLNQIPGHHEILVVDDGSTDRTGEILKELEKKHSGLRVLVHPRNQGIAKAQRWLIQEAKGELIFHLASDGEWKAGELLKLLDKLNEGYDIVIGVRRKKHYSLYRKVVSWFYNVLVLILFRKNLHDIGSIRLAKAIVWKNITAESNSAFFIAERLLLAHFNGARIGFANVDHVWRTKGKSKFNDPIKALRAFMEMLQFRLNRRHLKNLKINRTRTDR